MPYSIQLWLLIASLSPLKGDKKSQESGFSEADLRKVIEPLVENVCQLGAEFQQQRLTPTQACHFEQQLREMVRELGRLVSQWTYNQAEPAVETLPKHVWFEGMEYTRLNEKTPQNVWTLFGQVRLQRVPRAQDQFCQRDRESVRRFGRDLGRRAARDRVRSPHRLTIPDAGNRLRGSVLREGRQEHPSRRRDV